jgi:hypothetical protein
MIFLYFLKWDHFELFWIFNAILKRKNCCWYVVTEPPLKSGVCQLKIDWRILDEAKMHKHTYEA